MENKQEKTAAELYREERKQRMAKAAKKNAKKSPQLHKAGRALGKGLLIVIIAALCLGIVYGCLNFSGVLQRNILSAFKLGNKRISVAEYNYYYLEMYSRVVNAANQYDNTYGAGYGKMYTGYDTSLAPDKQSYTIGTVEGIENPTWADYLEDTAKQQIQIYTAYSDYARQADITLTDEQTEEIEENVKSYADSAKSNDFSLNRFLDNVAGKGVNEKLLRRILEDRLLAQAYAEKFDADTSEAITDEQIAKEFEDNMKDYTKFSIAIFKITADTSDIAEDATDDEKQAKTTEAMAAAKAKADEVIASSATQDAFVAAAAAYDSALTADKVVSADIAASSIESYVPDAIEWIMSSDRAVGDKAVFEVSDGYYVIYLISLPAKDTAKGVNVRHILVQFETTTDESGNTVDLTDEQKSEYYAKAQEIYDKYKENPTEDNFAALATEYSDDTGSKDNGGLYENVYPGTMVTEFNDWIFDASRQIGDTGIIETTYGYHIMYYAGNDNPEKWYSDVKTAISNNLIEDSYNAATKDPAYEIKPNKAILNWATEKLNDFIAGRITTSSASK